MNAGTLVYQTTINKDLLGQLIESFLASSSILPDNADVSKIHIEGLQKDLIPISVVYSTKQGGEEDSQDGSRL